MKRLLFLVVLVALLPSTVNAQTRIIEMGITAPEMAQYFQQHAGAQDIARVDHPNDIGLISGISVGKKMVIFKSASQIQQFMTSNASALDIIGYNLEPGQTHDTAELANPVAAAKAVQAIARQYGKAVAVGLTHDLTLQYGAAMAPYADIWVLQIQKAQNDPRMAGEFVSQMVPALQRANPNIVVFVQIRTDSSPAALAKLVNGLGNVHVSILTQRSDVQDAVNVAGAFFGDSATVQAGSSPANRQPRLYGDRLPSKDGQWLLPTPTLHLGSTDDDHVRRGSINSWDLVAPKGTPVYAARSGVVDAAGCNLYETHQWPIMQGYGCAVSIKHGDGIVSQYGHCDTGSIVVKVGQQVDEWSLLCKVGMTGQTSFGPHTHFTILRNGRPIRIDSIFDVNRMLKYQRLGNAVSNEVPAQIGVVGGNVVTGQQQQATVTTSKGQQLLQALASLPAEQFALLVLIVLSLLMFAWWLSGTYVRVVILATVTTVVVSGCIALLFMPTQVQATAVGQQSAMVGGDSWKTAYAFMRKWEGNRCVHDPVRTLKGITQGTYTAWRKSLGLGQADVCTSLTEEQAEAIYYQRYWLASGADKLEPAAALVVFDHAVNAGVGEGVALVAQCGSDVSCLIAARMADYKTKSNWRQYGQAWTNRVNDLVKFLKEG